MGLSILNLFKEEKKMKKNLSYIALAISIVSLLINLMIYLNIRNINMQKKIENENKYKDIEEVFEVYQP